MDEPRVEGDRVYGPPRITVLPRRDDDALPTLHVSRATDQALGFHVLTPALKWYPGSAVEQPQQLTWRAQRKQQRWIRGSHPDVIAGIAPDLLSDLLDQDASGPTAGRRSLLAIGQMTDTSLVKSRRPRAFLATAAGASGELLRLTSLRRTKWHWGPHNGDGDPALRLLDTDAESLEDVVLWSQDDSPIGQIKVAMNLADQDAPSRYVIVQKKLCTTVLRPQYHRLPVTGQAPWPDGGTTERPSRIEPRPVLTIPTTHTGGLAHSDFAYSPGSTGRPERLAIVDDHGFWTVWDMQGKIRLGSHDFFPRLRYCGHIRDGVLEQLPEAAETSTVAGFHGIFFVGPAKSNWSHWDAALDALDDPRSSMPGAAHRPRVMLVWSRTSLALVDLRQQTSFDHAKPLLRTRGDRILDVQLSPANQGHAFVLTSTTLFWVDLLASSEVQGLRILMSCAHLRSEDRDSLAMTVNHGWHQLGDEAGVVSIYASTGDLLDVFIFSTSPDGALPQFQHHKIRIPPVDGDKTDAARRIRSLCLAPALLDIRVPEDFNGPMRSPLPPPQGPGGKSMNREDRFWQLFVFDETLGLQSSLVAATRGDGTDLQPPDKNPELSDRMQWMVQRQRRTDVIRQLAETFVIPDAFIDADNIIRQAKKPRAVWQALLSGAQEEVDVAPPRWPRLGAEGVSRLAMQVGGSIESVALEVERLRGNDDGQAPSLFERLHQALTVALSEGGERRALMTLREYDPSFEAPPFDAVTEGNWDMQLGELLDVSDQRVVVDAVVPSFLGMEINSTISIAGMRQHIESLWSSRDLAPAAQQSRDLAIAEATEAALSSLFAVAVFDIDTAIQFDGLRSWVPDPEAAADRDDLGASQRSPYLTPRQSQSPSRPSSQLGSSQVSRASSQDVGSCPALQRLSMLAASLDPSRRVPGRAHDVLAFWPEYRGAGTTGYQSSVALSSTQHVAQVRKAQRADSQRRKKRTRITALPSSSVMDPTAFSSQALPPLRTERPAILVAPPPVFASDGPVIGGGVAARRLLKPEYTMSSQMPASSQSQGIGMGLGVMSQPVPGQHGKRPRPAKKKRKGGF
ncbi:RNA polymerase I-specific transcription-initiation factor-domain-containing protein [Plectosphaerella plurivora]|uniref:RNA polymerase I-specific transcription-initiation factor-domain-containing protein n=1 Tax=Plectosphaerella plurivora TaxID=936078 RepID=A0A9P9A834_9PEZI|nr:RNA polymerase I-specific transcription-initiation factor-domain-containing protein [Plectosphaerella plurivora]